MLGVFFVLFLCMHPFPNHLKTFLENRQRDGNYRMLQNQNYAIDFASNDYLGFAQFDKIVEDAQKILAQFPRTHGATASRLIAGNHPIFDQTEDLMAKLYDCESALIFNSGYDANLGFFEAVPQRGDFVLYDELIHASIRDGLRLSKAQSFKFKHNNLEDLEAKIIKLRPKFSGQCFVVTESVFSMDGDQPNLSKLFEVCEQQNSLLVLDEAHATGILGHNGLGALEHHDNNSFLLARMVTFGKALGCHGAAVLGSRDLRNFLINYARPLIYSTALPPFSIACVHAAYQQLVYDPNPRITLKTNIQHFRNEVKKLGLQALFIDSESAIQCCLISGNLKAKQLSRQLQEKGYDVRAILSPTVAKGKERLRFCLHAYNTTADITTVLMHLANFVKSA